MRASLIAVSLATGCFAGGPDPQLEISFPAAGDTITDHAPIVLRVEARDAAIDGFGVAIDNLALPPTFAVSPTPDGSGCDPCNFRITVPTEDLDEGVHVLSVHALEGGDLVASAAIDLDFDDTPELVDVSPEDHADLLGVGSVDVRIAVLERGEATATLAVDGVEVGTATSGECRGSGCELVVPWDSSTVEIGEHELALTVTDAHGHTTSDVRTVQIDDLVEVTGLEVTGIVDDSGTLEIEVYVFDDATNQLLGCAGSAHGLGPVDASDVPYAVEAQLVDRSGFPLHAAQLGTGALRFEVWEDDDDPVCPTLFNPNANDFIGAAPARELAAWKADPTATGFGGVTELSVLVGRPLRR